MATAVPPASHVRHQAADSSAEGVHPAATAMAAEASRHRGPRVTATIHGVVAAAARLVAEATLTSAVVATPGEEAADLILAEAALTSAAAVVTLAVAGVAAISVGEETPAEVTLAAEAITAKRDYSFAGRAAGLKACRCSL